MSGLGYSGSLEENFLCAIGLSKNVYLRELRKLFLHVDQMLLLLSRDTTMYNLMGNP